MKKCLLLSIITILIFLVSCTSKELDSPQKTITASETIETEGYILENIDFPVIPNFNLKCLKWIDDDKLVIIMNDFSPSSSTSFDDIKNRVYYFDIKNNNINLIYEGKFPGDNWNIQLKRPNDKDILLQGMNKALCIDSQTLKLKDLIIFPDNAFEGDISFDGKQIAYINEKGLYKDSIMATSPVLLFKNNLNEKVQRRPSRPLWSYNNINFCYLVISGDNSNDIVFTSPNGQSKQEYRFNDLTYGWWFKDNQKFTAFSAGASFGLTPIIKVINTLNGKTQDFKKAGNIEIECPPYMDTILYKQTDIEKKQDIYPTRLVLFDVITNIEEIVTPDFFDISSSEISPSGTIAFIGRQKPQEKKSIFIGRKKVTRNIVNVL